MNNKAGGHGCGTFPRKPMQDILDAPHFDAHRWYVTVVVLGWLVVGLPSCNGQLNSIVLCEAELRIGMPKAQVIAELGKQCKVQEFPHSDGKSWCVSGRYACSNQVWFENGNLISVSKDMGDAEGADAAELVATFMSAVERAVGGTPGKIASGPAIVTTHTSLGKDPETKRDIVVKELRLRLGQKEVVIQVNRPVGEGAHPIPDIAAIAASEELVRP